MIGLKFAYLLGFTFVSFTKKLTCKLARVCVCVPAASCA